MTKTVEEFLPTRTCGGLVTFFVRAHVAGFLVGSQHDHHATTKCNVAAKPRRPRRRRVGRIRAADGVSRAVQNI